MINQSPEQRLLYSSRLKSLMDEASRLESTRLEALQEGRLEERIQTVLTIQRLLKLPEMSLEELKGKTGAELTEIIEDLKRRF